MILPERTPRSVHEAATMVADGLEGLEILRLRQARERGEDPVEVVRVMVGKWLVHRWALYDTEQPLVAWCRAHHGVDEPDLVVRAVLSGAVELARRRMESER